MKVINKKVKPMNRWKWSGIYSLAYRNWLNAFL